MNWKQLDKLNIVEEIKTKSAEYPILIFKHSTRCSISSMALNRLERAWKAELSESSEAYLLDLIKNREISNAVASTFDVAHQSPQVLVIKDGKCVYHNSHMGISFQEISQQLASVA
ncbi:bacillithiol system protein YtxJ [Catalinimonas alkaloidigena]|uniref:bacillithiol system redox-active protein YtxJ n=1 Tax=Catalinimonas alkaloidigena TaxID=1075417 RepID=UPI002404E57F|nr:bacillithiol system redox-active protein YtxJ [Catalinimonas alkaloidigena]MDF9796882.1 bacillithiol system protein YtxJ [Catalinimonas alkaloidigena]